MTKKELKEIISEDKEIYFRREKVKLVKKYVFNFY